MFEDIGEKMKTVAKIMFILGCIASVIGAFTLGWFVIIIGPLFSWLGSIGLYGMGELIDETTRNCRVNNEILEILRKQKRENEKATQSSDKKPAVVSNVSSNLHRTASAGETWRCEKCGTVNDSTSWYCKDCGNYR